MAEMSTHKLLYWLPLLAGLAIFLAGCGGGGTGGTEQGSVSVFVTDGLDDQYSHVNVTVYQIAVGRQGDEGSFQSVFEDSAGLMMDVRALANLSQFLGISTLPAGTYNRARVVLGNQMQLTSTSGSSEMAALDAGVGRPLDGNKIAFEFPIQLMVQAMQNSTFVVDFDLPSFSIVNGLVRPALRHLREHEMGNRPHLAEIKGTVTEVGQGQFSLRLRNGAVVTVALTDQTVIRNERSGSPATLAVGQRVEVKGTVDTSTMTITAVRIKIKDTPDEDDATAEVKGWVKEISEGQFILQVRMSPHGQMGALVTVTYDEQTVWHWEEHSSAGPADLQVGLKVEVKGTYDPTSHTLSARIVDMEAESD